MKTIILGVLLVSTSLSIYAQSSWQETFKIPHGTTYRARAAGYDCGTFSNTYVGAPETFRSKGIEFKQLSADKDLNTFLFEAYFPSTEGKTCIYGVFFDRNRETKNLDFNHSIIKASENQNCQETKDFLDYELRSTAYEPSKRGIRYIAAQIVKDTANDVCESGNVRIVFDRRFTE